MKRTSSVPPSSRDDPLRARFDGTRLTVDAAKIEPRLENFTRGDADVIVGCIGLSQLKATVVKTTLTQE